MTTELVNDGGERTHRLDLPSAETDVDRKPFPNHRFLLPSRPRERPLELTAHRFGDADLAIEGRDQHKRRRTLFDVSAKAGVLGMNVSRVRHEPG
jgi:hypothetical protein